MYPDHLALSDRLKAAHGQSWQAIAKAGDFSRVLNEWLLCTRHGRR